jgi:uncharacterized repeat protein (TIGR03803 family)
MKRSASAANIQSLPRYRFWRGFTTTLAFVFWLFMAATSRSQTNIEIVLHSFTNSPDGAQPLGVLVPGIDHAFYGVTVTGGTNGNGGTLFKIFPDGSDYTVLHHFSTTDTSTRGLTSPPYPNLTVTSARDGTLYGTTYQGGTNGDGAIFKIAIDGTGYTVLHSFGASDTAPTCLIQGNDSALYGTCLDAVFRFDPVSGNYSVLHGFTNALDGNAAFGKLIQGNDGALYGTTFFGGTNNKGTVFRVTTNGDAYAILQNFGATPDGNTPYAGVIQATDGMLYGTTRAGGTNSHGTIYTVSTNGAGYKELYSLGSADGSAPVGSLIQGQDNVLFGTTATGGTTLYGSIFQINTDGTGFRVLYALPGYPDSAYSDSGLDLGTFTDGSGTLYGTATDGGKMEYGTVFALLINPPLTIAPVSSQTAPNQTVVVWPAWALNYTLQSTTNLTTGTWVTASNTVPLTGVQVTNAGPSTFYRLIRQ